MTFGEFNKSMILLRAELARAIELSESRIGCVHSGRQNYGLFIFAKMITHVMSFCLLSETVKPASEKTEMRGLLDHSSLCALARVAMDAAISLHYVLSSECDSSEWELRREVMRLHELCNRKRYMTIAARSEEKGSIPFFSTYAGNKEKYIQNIASLATSKGFSTEEIKRLTSGNAVFVRGVRGVVREAGLSVSDYDVMQALFSNHIHTHPNSFLRFDEQQLSFENPSEYQWYLSWMATSAVRTYLESVVELISNSTGEGVIDPAQ